VIVQNIGVVRKNGKQNKKKTIKKYGHPTGFNFEFFIHPKISFFGKKEVTSDHKGLI
jgi:hypothetical protein